MTKPSTKTKKKARVRMWALKHIEAGSIAMQVSVDRRLIKYTIDQCVMPSAWTIVRVEVVEL